MPSRNTRLKRDNKLCKGLIVLIRRKDLGIVKTVNGALVYHVRLSWFLWRQTITLAFAELAHQNSSQNHTPPAIVIRFGIVAGIGRRCRKIGSTSKGRHALMKSIKALILDRLDGSCRRSMPKIFLQEAFFERAIVFFAFGAVGSPSSSISHRLDFDNICRATQRVMKQLRNNHSRGCVLWN